MCAVKFAHIGSSLTDLKIFDVVEKSYDPQAEIKGFSNEIFSKVASLRDIAIVCALNNKSNLVYEEGKFNR
jgi:hypothetical protein